jgi:hypothetical protein
MKLFDIDKDKMDKWLESRPQVIRDLCAKVPPNYLYWITTTGQRVAIASYYEDGTVRVNVPCEHNPLNPTDFSVFGIYPDDLVQIKITKD